MDEGGADEVHVLVIVVPCTFSLNNCIWNSQPRVATALLPSESQVLRMSFRFSAVSLATVARSSCTQLCPKARRAASVDPQTVQVHDDDHEASDHPEKARLPLRPGDHDNQETTKTPLRDHEEIKRTWKKVITT